MKRAKVITEGEYIGVRVDRETIARLEALTVASGRRRTRSDVAREALEQGLRVLEQRSASS